MCQQPCAPMFLPLPLSSNPPAHRGETRRPIVHEELAFPGDWAAYMDVCAEAGAMSPRAVKKLGKLKATLTHIVEVARARHWTSKVHEYQGKLAALAAAEARGAPNEAELV